MTHATVAHRAHIALSELQLPFDEQTIDLQKPRTAEYLQINPRGLVPSLKYGDEIITESSTVATFLADAYPSHLIPAPNSPKDALARARIGFFVDTYSSKLNPLFFKQTWSPDGAERDALAKEFIDIVVKELEPLLSNAAPFFGGSERLTLAEVCLQWYSQLWETFINVNASGSNWAIRHSRPYLTQARSPVSEFSV